MNALDNDNISFSRRFNQFKISISRRGLPDKVFMKYYNELNRSLNLPPKIHNKSVEIFERINKKDILRNRDFRYTVAACIMAASRELGIYVAPNSFEAKAKSKGTPSELKPALVLRSYKRIQELEPDFKISKIDFDGIINSLGERLILGDATIETAKEKCNILNEAFKKNSRTFKPSGIAAAALYLACLYNGEPHTQKEIAKHAGVSEVTIRNIIKSANL